MTTATETPIGTGFAVLPRVNLLPPEVLEQRRFRRVQYGLGAAVGVCVLIVLGLYVMAAHSVSNANAHLNSVNAQIQALDRQQSQFSDVTAIRAEASGSQAMLVQAMGQEILFSHLLNDLSLTIPDNVWLTTLSLNQGAVSPGTGQTTAGVGTISVSAVGFSLDDVAAWLDALAAQPDFLYPDFGSASQTSLGTRKIVNFSSTATLAPSVLSNRYSTPAGG